MRRYKYTKRILGRVMELFEQQGGIKYRTTTDEEINKLMYDPKYPLQSKIERSIKNKADS